MAHVSEKRSADAIRERLRNVAKHAISAFYDPLEIRFIQILRGPTDDAVAIRGDWEAVGDGLRLAIEDFGELEGASLNKIETYAKAESADSQLAQVHADTNVKISPVTSFELTSTNVEELNIRLQELVNVMQSLHCDVVELEEEERASITAEYILTVKHNFDAIDSWMHQLRNVATSKDPVEE